MIQLYNYFRSSASYRVRIALELKGLSFDYIPVHLTRDGGEQFKPEYRKLNPDALPRGNKT
jgi:maleylpyruvate isomerase